MALRSLSVVCAVLGLACGPSAGAVTQAPVSDTLEAHARAQDDEGIRRATLLLASKAREERMRGLAALLEYEPARLQSRGVTERVRERALHAESTPEKVAAVWVLVHAGDASVVPAALRFFDAGDLQHAVRLDGVSAFDVVALAKLVAMTPDTLPAEWVATRNKVMAAALPSADAKMRAVLVRALIDDDDDGALLASAAEALDPQKDFVGLEHLFQRLRALADPRAASQLAHYADHASHPHFRTEAALRLAELGDLRGAPHLAWRLGEDPTKLYDASDPNVVALVRDDHERVVAARMLAELAMLHPEAHTQLHEMVDGPCAAWMRSHPQPHPSALRLLVAVESPQAAPTLRKLADPTEPLPVAGAQTMPDAFAGAESALRFLGRSRDASAWPVLEKQLGRKPATFDDSMDALMKGGVAVIGMTYRALVHGAVQGFWELADPKAVPLLMKLAEDPKSNEQARLDACNAVADVADGPTRRDIVSKVRAASTDRKREFQRACWLTGLAQRPNATLDAPLLSLFAPKTEPESRHQAARLLGQGGLGTAERAKLIDMLSDKVLVHDAALALLFGGDAASVAKVFAAYAPNTSTSDDAVALPPIEPLRQLYIQSVPALTEELENSGALARMASLAVAARDITLRGTKQEWVLQGFSYQLKQMGELDAEPHSLTRVRLRAKLLADARGTDAKKRDDALLLLWVLGERASLASLSLTLGDLAKARLAEPSP